MATFDVLVAPDDDWGVESVVEGSDEEGGMLLVATGDDMFPSDEDWVGVSVVGVSVVGVVSSSFVAGFLRRVREGGEGGRRGSKKTKS